MKKNIKINENQLEQIVAESVKSVISEGFGRPMWTKETDDSSVNLNVTMFGEAMKKIIGKEICGAIQSVAIKRNGWKSFDELVEQPWIYHQVSEVINEEIKKHRNSFPAEKWQELIFNLTQQIMIVCKSLTPLVDKITSKLR